MPIIVVADDPDGMVAAALAGAPVTLAAPAPLEGGPVAQIARGMDVASSEISGTAAALVWPARLCWAGPETVTSLIEAYGVDPDALLRPAYGETAGWPALLPVALLPAFRVLSPVAMPDELLALLTTSHSADVRLLDLGDPGTVIDGATARDDLPPYDGPTTTRGAHAHEWGAAAAATPEDAPLVGPSIAAHDPS